MTSPSSDPPGVEGLPPRQALDAPRVTALRPDPRVAFLDVRWPGYREFFCVVTATETVTVLAFDASDESFDGPRLLHIPRPYGWRPDADDEELLLQVWQATGHQR